MKITMVGAGAWGTSLARLLRRNGHDITLWAHEPQILRAMAAANCNEQFLPGIPLPRDFSYEEDLEKSLAVAEAAIVAVPSQVFRHVTARMSSFQGMVVSVTKGIEHGSGLSMSGVLAQTCPKARGVALSGPSFALEVARDIPTAVVVASDQPSVANAAQELFLSTAFRVYTTTDILGVELGGALKNVIAIAAGLSDGLGFGDNSKAALVTRGIVEMKRLGVACGARGETFNGLSGLGDLMVTCFSKLSRNRGFGERVARGEKAPDIAQSMVAVAEGYPTAKSACHLARAKRVSTPIIDEVYAMLYEGKDVARAVRDLMTRDPKAEQ